MRSRVFKALVLAGFTVQFLTGCSYEGSDKDKNGILLFRSLTSESLESPSLYEGEIYSGPVVQYYKDGTLEFKGQFKDGFKYGAWDYYHSDGKLIKEETAQPSQGDYQVKTYRRTTGRLLTELIGRGEDTLHFKKYHHNGKLGQELQNNGTRIFQKWTSFGNLYHYYNEDSITVTMDTKTREITEKGFFKNGQKTGLWFKRYPNGNIAYEKNYKAGRLFGKSVDYYLSGNIETESNYNENGYLEGAYKVYHETKGILLKGQYDSQGGKIGTWRYYTEEGKLLEVKNYNSNRLDGLYEYYYPNKGIVQEKGYYKNGRKVGTWSYYGILGDLKEEVEQGD